MWLFKSKMLHYVHQLVADSVCLLFGIGQVEYSF